MTQYAADAAYNGGEKLFVAIDIGTTNTAVAYLHLCPGVIPKPKMVMWKQADGFMKIPSIVAYQNGQAQAYGAEAVEFINDDEYEIAEWFKLRCHPLHMDNSATVEEMPELPESVTIDTVYSDFLRYLHTQTREFFIDETGNGADIWSRVQENINLIFTIPNGWNTSQQDFLRTAAERSGWVKPGKEPSHVTFVTESEASVHYTVEHQTGNWLDAGTQFLVVDAGGSTVDSTLYECISTSPKLVLQEVRPSTSILAGGIFVDRALTSLLERKLAKSKYHVKEFKQRILEKFEKTIKRRFDGSQNRNEIEFGFRNDNDQSVGIAKGKLQLSNDEVKSAFKNAAKRIKRDCRELLKGRKVKYVVLVGGFGDSPYLRRKLKEKLKMQIITANEPVKKAAAEGAVIWSLKGLVAGRAARYSYGVKCCIPFEDDNPSHLKRVDDSFTDSEGNIQMRNSFSILIEKNDVINNGYTVFEDYFRLFYHNKPARLECLQTDILVYHGEDHPEWCADEKGELLAGFQRECTIRADLSGLYPLLKKDIDEEGDEYWRVDYQIGIQFGGTELKAVLQWKEGENVCQSLAAVIPDSTWKCLTENTSYSLKRSEDPDGL